MNDQNTTREETAGQTVSGQGLPTFEEIRSTAYALLGDAADWLRSDWAPGTGPNQRAAAALRRAFVGIAAAKTALNDAAHAQRDTGSTR